MRNLQATLMETQGRHRSGLTLIELLVVIGIMLLLAALFLPATRTAREAARRTQCKNNLKQIGLALHNYHDLYGGFPPAVTADAVGPIHGWRTQMLPYVDQTPLYDSIDLSRPWDDPANTEGVATGVPEFQCPSPLERLSPEETTYAGIVGPNACLLPRRSRSLKQITDGPSETLMVIDVDREAAVPWAAPRDGGAEFFRTFGPETYLQHAGGTQALLADGSVRFFSTELSQEVRRGLVTADGGEPLGEF